MLTVDCKDVVSIKNDLLIYVADQVAAFPTLKHHQFTLSTLDDDEILDTTSVISAIKEYLCSIHEENNFAVIANSDVIHITSISGRVIEKTNDIPSSSPRQHEMLTCTHCGFITQYPVELNVHMKIHYI